MPKNTFDLPPVPTHLTPSDAPFKQGDVVCHSNLPNERYRVTLSLRSTSWAVRLNDDEEEVMLLNEHLSSCSL